MAGAGRRAGFEPDVRYITDVPGIALSFVARGLAAAIVPEIFLASIPDGVRGVPMDPLLTRRTLAAIRAAPVTDRPWRPASTPPGGLSGGAG